MGQSIPIGPWPDFETAQAFGGQALKVEADENGEVVSEWAALRRSDGLWQVEGYCHRRSELSREGRYIVAGSTDRPPASV